jgi:catechol 2,3-dioxygenase-like lactoylglutathione lyase family enzyme
VNGWILDRPAPVCDPDKGLLNAEHFQIAYATNDIAGAERFFRERFGVAAFRPTEGENGQGGRIEVRSAWIGGVMYEIICGSGPGMEVYSDGLPQGDGFALRHHHFGYLIPDETAWDRLQRAVERGGWSVRGTSDTPGYVRAMFVAVPEFGHLLEFVLPAPALLERFAATPIA